MNFVTIGSNIIKVLSQYWKVFLLEGLSNTLLLTVIAVSLGALLGTLVAILKMSRFKVVRFLISI